MFKQIDKRLNFNIFLQMFVLFTPLVQAAQMAIVIDDVGYRIKEDREILALPKAVSVAIIPVAPYATERAKDAYNQKRDILIHLPMEPKSKQPIEEGVFILVITKRKFGNLFILLVVKYHMLLV